MTLSPGLTLSACLALALASPPAEAQVPSTAADFHQPGTQPGGLHVGIFGVSACSVCHGNYAEDQEPYERWSGSMMANSVRDPLFHAALTIANQDMHGSGELCLRCHAPVGWLSGHATPTDGSALNSTDYQGTNCHVCHRLVDPIADPANPAEDSAILAALAQAPATSHGGQYVVDPEDRRRGPFDLGPSFAYHAWRQSPYHRESLLCATCHETSNPVFLRNGGPTPSASDSYDLDTLGADHPTHAAQDEFPLERTFTEWNLSAFAVAPIDMGGRFGGNQPLVSSCQDCHMPDTDGTACRPSLGGATRTDVPQHDFRGANSWVPRSIYELDQTLALYPSADRNGQPLAVFEAAIARNEAMLRAASDLSLTTLAGDLIVRITNQSGHKLPTGYADGRRMWINVKFYGAGNALVAERGHYDFATAELTTSDTKVYELRQGLDANMAALTGLPEEASYHYALNNKVYKDNRIPPRGFTNASFEAGQSQPVGASYADGQYWDDTSFAIPTGARYAVVSVYYQTTSKEYVEFLQSENVTDSKGNIAYDQWVAASKSRPVRMDRGTFLFYPQHVRPR